MKKIAFFATILLLAFSGCSQKNVEINADDIKKKDVNQKVKEDKKDTDSKLDAIKPLVDDNNTNNEDKADSLNANNNDSSTNSYDVKAIEDKLNVIYFAFDRYDINEDMMQKIGTNAEYINKLDSNKKIKLEGNCDEWGTDEYNYALGLKRAKSVKDALVSFGIDSQKIQLLSYGESNPVCTEHNQACWQKNRRVDTIILP